jgi:hypothetical protein
MKKFWCLLFLSSLTIASCSNPERKGISPGKYLTEIFNVIEVIVDQRTEDLVNNTIPEALEQCRENKERFDNFLSEKKIDRKSVDFSKDMNYDCVSPLLANFYTEECEKCQK